MDQHLSQPLASGRWSDEFARSLAASRAHLAEIEQEHMRRVTTLESQIAERLEKLQLETAGQQRSELAAEQADRERAERELTELRSALNSTRQDKDRVADDLSNRVRELSELHARHDALQGDLTSVRHDLEATRRNFEQLQAELETERQRSRQAAETASQSAAHADEARNRLRELEQALGGERSELEKAMSELLAERDQLVGRIEESAARYADLQSRLVELERQSDSATRERDSQLAELAATNAHLQREFDERGAALEQAKTKAAELNAALDAERHSLGEKARELTNRLTEANAATQSVQDAAQAARQQLENVTAELEQARSQADEARRARDEFERRASVIEQSKEQSDAQLAANGAELERLRAEIAAREASSAGNVPTEVHELVKREAENLRESVAQAEQQLRAVASERDSLQECLNEAIARPASDPAAEKRLQAVAAERDRLADQLADLQERLAEAELAAKTPSEDAAQLAKKYDLAINDLHEAKRRIVELERAKIAKGTGASDATAGALDWESQKRRLLEALEADQEEETAEQAAERVKMQEVVSRTDAIVDAKNREIEELRHTLEQQSSSLGGVAVGAAAFGQMFAQDEFIQQERERISQIKAEWEEKLRGAEVELSLQRAQVARDRAKLEELQRAMEHATSGKSDPGKKGQKGWRAMMGLGESG